MRRYIRNHNEILQKYRTTSEQEFNRKYNIILNEDGTVFDKTENKCYNTLSQWVQSIKEINV